MKRPAVSSVMERRLLINYRVDPDLLASILPAPFRPLLYRGYRIAGICLIRLGGIRPAGLPAALGITAENVAHRIAVMWEGAEGPVTGVYIPRRDTNSRLVALVGGRIFPGWHQRARFDSDESAGRYRVQISSRDSTLHVAVDARIAGSLMPGSIFRELHEASEFFRSAPIGYSAALTTGVFKGVKLATDRWRFHPLHVTGVASSFFDDPVTFPPGTAVLDSAFVMGGVRATWRAEPRLCVTTARTAALAARST